MSHRFSSRVPSHVVLRVVAAVVVPALALSACGGDDAHEASTETVVPTADAIVIEVDGDTTTPPTETVPVGSTVSLQIAATEEQEFHLHGYDLESEGAEVTITFVADQAGEFELERHDNGQVVLVLDVEA